MPIKPLIARGLGFSPGSTRYILSNGLSIVSFPPPEASITTLGFGQDPRIILRGYSPDTTPPPSGSPNASIPGLGFGIDQRITLRGFYSLEVIPPEACVTTLGFGHNPRISTRGFFPASGSVIEAFGLLGYLQSHSIFPPPCFGGNRESVLTGISGFFTFGPFGTVTFMGVRKSVEGVVVDIFSNNGIIPRVGESLYTGVTDKSGIVTIFFDQGDSHCTWFYRYTYPVGSFDFSRPDFQLQVIRPFPPELNN
jgi:hypothetical protein